MHAPLRGNLHVAKPPSPFRHLCEVLYACVQHQQRWRDHDNADCVADPKLKHGVRKTGPGYDAACGIADHKAAGDETGTGYCHSEK